MRLNLTSGSAPPWVYKFVTAELWDEESSQIFNRGMIPNSVVEFFKSKGITAWREGHSVWIDVDLDTPEWTMRMLKYSGET